MSTITILEQTIEIFKNDPSVPNLHATALKKYKIFCSNRTVDLYTTFFKLIGEEDLSWCSEATYKSSFRANVPFPGKVNERNVSGGVSSSQRLQGIVRYEYKNYKEEDVVEFSEINLDGGWGQDLNYTEDLDKYDIDKVSNWLYEYHESTSYSEESISAFYMPNKMESIELPWITASK